MNWDQWHKHYDSLPSFQERLRIVREQIIAALDACPPGPIRIVSICAGDGRDVIGAVQNHPRRHDVSTLLIDTHVESTARGKAAAKAAGLERQLRFVEADATLAKNYLGAVPANLVLLSGFLGHLRHEDVTRLIASLPMFCFTGGWAIWNRHLVLHDGHEQVPAIREFFRQTKFEEIFFAAPDLNGFAVGRVRFAGRSEPLDTSRVLFEFVGLDHLLTAPPGLTEPASDSIGAVERFWTSKADILDEAETSIPARFREMVAIYPTRTALGGCAWRPTYAELNSTANRLAHTILSRNGKPGDRVALLMQHDSPLIAAALAILKTGRAVVVLNPADPPAHLKQILDDAAPGCIVSDSLNLALAAQIAQSNHRVICFELADSGPSPNPDIPIAPIDIAWLIYTSGSTGRPKGVIQTHRNIVHNVMRLSHGMNLTADDRILLLSPPGGGLSVATLWCALLNGAALFPFPVAEKGMTGLKKWMLENRTSVYVSSASVFRNFTQTLIDPDFFPDTRLVRLGSEPATVSDFAAFKKYFPETCALFSSFSSSETGNITQQLITQIDGIAEGRLPVGWPAAGMEFRLLDESRKEVSDGQTGEIVIKSHYLSPGYWRNESLTAERFFASRGPGAGRIFLSGDLGRRLADGSLMFMGRKDTRVKIHGYRIELSEVENVLLHQPEVAGAVVCPREAPNHDLQLVAYVVPGPGRKCTAETLRRELRSILPGYMVPASFVFLEKFPLSAQGKIDRQALPPPPENRPTPTRGSRPQDVVEAQLARIWQSVLGLSRIGRNDNFFDLGGTSIQSAEVLAHIEELFGASLSPSTLVEYSTIEQLAGVVAGYVVIPSPGPLVTLRAADTGRPLFLVHSGQGEVTSYGLLVRRLPGRPIYGLQSVGLQGESWPLMSIRAMAQRYLSEVVAKDPTGPYLLGATCMGGMVAFEMALTLARQGRQVGLLALFDVPGPLPKWQHHDRVERLYGPVRDPVRDAFRILRWATVRAAGLGRTPRGVSAYRRFVAHMNSRANRRYHPDFFPGTLTLFLTADQSKYPRLDLRLAMRQYATETRIIPLPGNRTGLFARPVVDELARQLQMCLDPVEGKRPP